MRRIIPMLIIITLFLTGCTGTKQEDDSASGNLEYSKNTEIEIKKSLQTIFEKSPFLVDLMTVRQTTEFLNTYGDVAGTEVEICYYDYCSILSQSDDLVFTEPVRLYLGEKYSPDIADAYNEFIFNYLKNKIESMEIEPLFTKGTFWYKEGLYKEPVGTPLKNIAREFPSIQERIKSIYDNLQVYSLYSGEEFGEQCQNILKMYTEQTFLDIKPFFTEPSKGKYNWGFDMILNTLDLGVPFNSTLSEDFQYDFNVEISDDNIRESISLCLQNIYSKWLVYVKNAVQDAPVKKEAFDSVEEIKKIISTNNSCFGALLDCKNYDTLYMKFFKGTGAEDIIKDKFKSNVKLALSLFEGLDMDEGQKEDFNLCNKLLKENFNVAVHKGVALKGGPFEISFMYNYPLKIENIYNALLKKYKDRDGFVQFNLKESLSEILPAEAHRGQQLNLGIFGRSEFEISFDYKTGNIKDFSFNNCVSGSEAENWGGDGVIVGWATYFTDIDDRSVLYHNYNIWNDNIVTYLENDVSENPMRKDLKIENWGDDKSDYNLNISATGYNPYKYKLVVYINVEGTWWPKPFYNKTYLVGLEEKIETYTNTGGIDETATIAAAMVVPIDTVVGEYYVTKNYSVAYAEIKR